MRAHTPLSRTAPHAGAARPSLWWLLSRCCALLLSCGALTACDPEGAEGGAPSAPEAGVSAVDVKADLPLGYSEAEAQSQAQEALREDLISLYHDFVDKELAIDAESSPWDFSGCLVCGRETGFLPTPALTLDDVYALEGKDTSYVSLSWGAVEGATEYRVVIVQVREGALVDVIDVDVTTTTLGVGLELGFDYFVYVVASNPETKRRSEPSSPLLLSCVDGERCAPLDSYSGVVP
jgi:hypothetical protein